MSRIYQASGTIFLAGLFILVFPDKGHPVIRFNGRHGPSLIDLVGLLFMLAGWLISCIMVIGRIKNITERLGKKNVYLLVGFYFVFLSGIVLSLFFSFEWILWICTAAASMINITFILFALRSENQL